MSAMRKTFGMRAVMRLICFLCGHDWRTDAEEQIGSWTSRLWFRDRRCRRCGVLGGFFFIDCPDTIEVSNDEHSDRRA